MTSNLADSIQHHKNAAAMGEATLRMKIRTDGGSASEWVWIKDTMMTSMTSLQDPSAHVRRVNAIAWRLTKRMAWKGRVLLVVEFQDERLHE